MKVDFFLPHEYNADESSVQNIYKTEQDYINALNKELEYGNSIMNDSMVRIGDKSTYRFLGNKGNGDFFNYSASMKYKYVKSSAVIFNPMGTESETIDSMIDKFVKRSEFILLVKFDENGFDDDDFEEELNIWYKETCNIKKYIEEESGPNATMAEKDKMLDDTIPRRDMKMEFMNKSHQRLSWVLEKCEIEQKLNNTAYRIYVNKMVLEK